MINKEQIEKNKKALDYLHKQRFKDAQVLFFDNAKVSHSHEAYNNLGYFLCTEGLECQNGKVRNADKLGMHYLLKAEGIKTTAVNQCNIADEYEKLRYWEYRKTGINNVDICRAAFLHMEQAVKIKSTNVNEYNRLRFLYFCDKFNTDVFNGIKRLVSIFENENSVVFYMSLLCVHSQYQRCLDLIPKYATLLDEVDLLSFYCLCGEYQKGASLCDSLYEKYFLSEDCLAMLVCCLINSSYQDKARTLKNQLQVDADGLSNKKERLCKIERIFNDTAYRNTLIQNYCFQPVHIKTCGYFGCQIHGNMFFEIDQ